MPGSRRWERRRRSAVHDVERRVWMARQRRRRRLRTAAVVVVALAVLSFAAGFLL